MKLSNLRSPATYLRKTTQAVTALLVLIMSTILVLPPGLDLVLCFGKDGQIDFLLNGCPDSTSPKIPTKEWSDTTQHIECVDVTVACSMAQELVRFDGKFDSYTSAPKRDPVRTFFLFPEALADSVDTTLARTVYPTPLEDTCSSHLVFLRTVVLLI